MRLGRDVIVDAWMQHPTGQRLARP